MDFPPITTVVLIITGAMTFVAFRRRDLCERWMFKPREILQGKQFDRMLTSGFIHGDWMHFAFNAYSFYSFGRNIEYMYGWPTLLLIHLVSIFGGSVLSLVLHRHHDYRALGASGGVCGVIFASIFLLPGGEIRHLFLIPIPTYIYAIIFLLASYYGHRKGVGNVGHDAHLGGAIIGLLVAAAIYPQMITAAPGMFIVVLVLSLTILALLIFDPLRLLAKSDDANDVGLGGDRAQRYAANRTRNEKLAEIDQLLEKVSQHGINSLSRRERERLETLSKDVHRTTRTD